MLVDQAVFLRIDTQNGTPCLQGEPAEKVVETLLETNKTGWFNLLGFVVLPSEIQIMFVANSKPTIELVAKLEFAVREKLVDIKTVFDTEFYKEKVDSPEEIQDRLKWMLQAPLRSRLATRIDAYPLSSANERYRSSLTRM